MKNALALLLCIVLLNAAAWSGGLLNYGNTIRLLADNQTCTATAGCSSGSVIIVTTAATAIPVFTFNNLRGGAINYNFHCEVKYNQATAGGGVGVAIASGTQANKWTANAKVYLTAATFTHADSGQISGSTALTQVVAPAANTSGTTFGITIDGQLESILSHVTPSQLQIGFYSGSASDAVTIKEGSYCAMVP
jgi:hypothetical protein